MALKLRTAGSNWTGILKEYVNNHTYKYSAIDSEEKKVNAHPDFIEEISSELDEAVQLMNNQIIVYMCTIMETALNDFFKCIFIKNPSIVEGIKKYIDENCDLGVSYSDFLKYDSKEDYIIEISKRAAVRCNSGKIDKILNRISKMLKLDLPTEYCVGLRNLAEYRNKIVHENIHINITTTELQNLSDNLENSLMFLGNELRKMGILVKDNGGFLAENT